MTLDRIWAIADAIEVTIGELEATPPESLTKSCDRSNSHQTPEHYEG